jgi:hypothetical protein
MNSSSKVGMGQGGEGHGFFFKFNIGAIWGVLIGSYMFCYKNFLEW